MPVGDVVILSAARTPIGNLHTELMTETLPDGLEWARAMRVAPTVNQWPDYPITQLPDYPITLCE